MKKIEIRSTKLRRFPDRTIRIGEMQMRGVLENVSMGIKARRLVRVEVRVFEQGDEEGREYIWKEEG